MDRDSGMRITHLRNEAPGVIQTKDFWLILYLDLLPRIVTDRIKTNKQVRFNGQMVIWGSQTARTLFHLIRIIFIGLQHETCSLLK